MHSFFISIILVLIVGVVTSLDAQSRPSQPVTEIKANQRKVEPTPTPVRTSTPLPASTIDKSQSSDDSEVIRVNTQLVSVPVRVMDKTGRFIGGIPRESFKVYEDGVEQEVAMFSNETEPFTVALVLDMSYSTTFKLTEIQSAAIEFIEQLRPQDKVMVISFDAEVHVLCDPTEDRKEIYRAIRATKISTGTSLYEAVDLVMNRFLQKVDGRKAIILFTDGVDTTSRRSNDAHNLSDALELDALIYPIQYDTFADVQTMKNQRVLPAPPPITVSAPRTDGEVLANIYRGVVKPSTQGTTEAEYKKADEYLEQLSVRTGGRIYEAKTLGNLADAYSKIASELREFYSIGYYPTSERVDGKRSNVKVRVNRDGLVVRSREEFIRRKPVK